MAYQLALQAQRTKQHQNLPVGAAADVIDTKSSRPVPKPRGSVRKSGVSGALALTQGVSMTMDRWISAHTLVCSSAFVCLSAGNRQTDTFTSFFVFSFFLRFRRPLVVFVKEATC